MRPIAICFLFMWMALCVGGCSTRENAKSLAMADQGIDASLRTLQLPDFIAAIESIEQVEINSVIVDRLNTVGQFLAQARDNIASPLQVLANGEPIQTDITTEQALLDPQAFIKVAAKQAAKAEVEAEQYLWWHSTLNSFKGYISGENGLLAQVLMLFGVGGGTAATLAAAAQSLIKRAKISFAEKAYEAEAEKAQSKEELQSVKDRHRAMQKANQVHGHIAKRLEKKRRPA